MAWKKKLQRSLVIHFLLLFIVFDSLGMLIFFLFDSSLLQKAKEREMAVVQELMTDLSYLLVSQIDYYSMTVLIGSKVISEYREHSTEFNSNTIDLFNFILMNNPSIFQIRMISDEGYERIRLDQSEGLISLTDEKDLQYKGDRYYFQESFKLNYGEVYLSPIDLNIENSKIEIPYRPTIRLGTPIFDHENRKIGVAVLNIDLSSVLNQFKEKSNSSLSIELLNSNGYYIAGPDSTSLWGFMFNKPITMAINNPKIWNYIRRTQKWIRQNG